MCSEEEVDLLHRIIFGLATCLLLKFFHRFSKHFSFHYPEVGSSIVCRNVGRSSSNDAAHTRNPRWCLRHWPWKLHYKVTFGSPSYDALVWWRQSLARGRAASPLPLAANISFWGIISIFCSFWMTSHLSWIKTCVKSLRVNLPNVYKWTL